MDMMGQDGPAGPEDGAERAFEALRAELAAQRRALERMVAALAASGRQADEPAPDYSPTLGAMARELEGIGARLDAMEAHPALRLSPAAFADQVAAADGAAIRPVIARLGEAERRLEAERRELEALVGVARTRREQREWALAFGGCGLALGVALWLALPSWLPWGAGDWMAASLVGGGRWGAGAALMERANPAAFDRMARLYKACGERPTEACEAALAGQANPPGQAPMATSGSRTPAFGTVPAHNRAGAGH